MFVSHRYSHRLPKTQTLKKSDNLGAVLGCLINKGDDLFNPHPSTSFYASWAWTVVRWIVFPIPVYAVARRQEVFKGSI
ncbi:uncharacterized protein BDW43DRAFT_284097 [Aspergillus alliaceus]|uniref:uncharacterized protein n=1 Tax=Petromyces alliaceus TaxID=209559 RepID=UPI0012A49735|nr:uncharacterized protein BDW43DRAFT_284097 [Aspergillus alliaceus]KAB8230835.1 hypothetical protein BDW43DRAFT_284097 [Aspergillus alliaceus]